MRGAALHDGQFAAASEGDVVPRQQRLVWGKVENAVVPCVPWAVDDEHIFTAVRQAPGALAFQLHLALAAAQDPWSAPGRAAAQKVVPNTLLRPEIGCGAAARWLCQLFSADAWHAC